MVHYFRKPADGRDMKKALHGYGGNWGGAKASYHHNLLAHHDSRAPRLGPKAGTQTREYMDLRNNVIYNWSGNGLLWW